MSRLGERHVDDVTHPSGRWPANVVLDEDAAAMLDAMSGESTSPGNYQRKPVNRGAVRTYGMGAGIPDLPDHAGYGDTGGASRFMYVAPADDPDTLRFAYIPKASRRDRGEGNTHSTVKPTALMSWLLTLIVPPGGVVLDPFAGSGTTGVAAARLGMTCILIEQDESYCEIAARRIGHALNERQAEQERQANVARQLEIAAD